MRAVKSIPIVSFLIEYFGRFGIQSFSGRAGDILVDNLGDSYSRLESVPEENISVHSQILLEARYKDRGLGICLLLSGRQ